MESLDSMTIIQEDDSSLSDLQDSQQKSFLLVDGKEYLKVSSADSFVEKLGCNKKNQKVKVVSIFGNTGDGKSHTLNQTFFKGQQVFCTSNEQNSCTLGVWTAFDPYLNVICLDTEGLLGTWKNTKSKTNFLLLQKLLIEKLFCRCDNSWERKNKVAVESFGSVRHSGLSNTIRATAQRPVYLPG